MHSIVQKMKRGRNVLLALFLAFWQAMVPLLVTQNAYATVNEQEEHKIRICHRTASYSNPYVDIEVDQNAADGVAGNSGQQPDHYGEHQGPIFYPLIPKHTEWGDIIPPIDGVHDGYNWTDEGQAIWENNCEFPKGSVKVEKRVDTDGDGTFELGSSDSNAEKLEIKNLGFRWALDDEDATREMGSTAEDVTAGEHTVTENSINGYTFVGWYVTGNTNGKSCANPQGKTLPIDITVTNGVNNKITLCNKFNPGTITIHKDAVPHTDTDFKFTTNFSDPFYLDDEPGAGVDNTPETKVFENLKPGTYIFTEEDTEGWYLKFIECSEGATVVIDGSTVTITLEAGEAVTCTYRNNKIGQIRVTKRTIPEGNETRFDIKASGTNTIFSESEKTIADGETQTFDVKYGTYKITEDVPKSWIQTKNTCVDMVIDYQNLVAECEIENTYIKKYASITVTKFNDHNKDGCFNDDEWCKKYSEIAVDEQALPGWNITLGEETKTTDENGEVVFENIEINPDWWMNFHEVSEEMQDGWNFSSFYCHQRRIIHDDDSQVLVRAPGLGLLNAPYNQENETPFAGGHVFTGGEEHLECFIGNYHNPVLNLTKSNNRPDPTVTGDTVTYTLVASLTEESSLLCDAFVKDVKPDNFSYVAGSWTAVSNLRGDLKLAGVTTDPIYLDNTGMWQLGTMLPGEVITLTYQAYIEDVVSPGTYPDIAYAQGIDCPTCDEETGEVVLSNLSHADVPFVGTEVTVIGPEEPGQVLGVSTLADTGTPTSTLQFALPAAMMLLVAAITRRQKKGGRA